MLNKIKANNVLTNNK